MSGYQDVGVGLGANGTATNTTNLSGGSQYVGVKRRDRGGDEHDDPQRRLSVRRRRLRDRGRRRTRQSPAAALSTSAVTYPGNLGTATETTILDGGVQVVGFLSTVTGTATSTTIKSGGVEQVVSALTTVDRHGDETTINHGCSQFVGYHAWDRSRRRTRSISGGCSSGLSAITRNRATAIEHDDRNRRSSVRWRSYSGLRVGDEHDDLRRRQSVRRQTNSGPGSVTNTTIEAAVLNRRRQFGTPARRRAQRSKAAATNKSAISVGTGSATSTTMKAAASNTSATAQGCDRDGATDTIHQRRRADR